jgi:hypothetical protein
MALEAGPAEEVLWSEQEVTEPVNYLYEHRSEAGDGENFKAGTFKTATNHITPYLLQGPPKTAKMCMPFRFPYEGRGPLMSVSSAKIHLCRH